MQSYQGIDLGDQKKKFNPVKNAGYKTPKTEMVTRQMGYALRELPSVVGAYKSSSIHMTLYGNYFLHYSTIIMSWDLSSVAYILLTTDSCVSPSPDARGIASRRKTSIDR